MRTYFLRGCLGGSGLGLEQGADGTVADLVDGKSDIASMRILGGALMSCDEKSCGGGRRFWLQRAWTWTSTRGVFKANAVYKIEIVRKSGQ